ncbi:N-acetylglucosaminyl-phosphatidylinositol de-N-acetylase [Centruroides vittatus]|uniref:N-acetylglucosaminyl-phosphatidylinositol de-N-acetylase n=1 Tax=Centruroides vittatus TaxID=120091 RepID=UPI00350FB35D
MMDILTFLSGVIMISVITYLIINVNKFVRNIKCVKKAKKVLVVVAHPDDECMFFAPTLINLCKREKSSVTEVHLLCLSSGNYYSQGKLRKIELRKSCQILGIPLSNITVVQHTSMPDDPMCLWREDLVGNIILKFIEKLSIDTVFTFDEKGISGHLNHKSLYNGLNYLLEEGLIPRGCKIYLLETVNIFRKYSIIFDLIISLIWSNRAFISSLQEVRLAQNAMSCHVSQLLWFRKLYMIFSRYIFINTYKKLTESHYSFHKDK